MNLKERNRYISLRYVVLRKKLCQWDCFEILSNRYGLKLQTIQAIIAKKNKYLTGATPNDNRP